MTKTEIEECIKNLRQALKLESNLTQQQRQLAEESLKKLEQEFQQQGSISFKTLAQIGFRLMTFWKFLMGIADFDVPDNMDDLLEMFTGIFKDESGDVGDDESDLRSGTGPD